MAELTSRPSPALHRQALEKAKAECTARGEEDCYLVRLFSAMNPQKLSAADFDSIITYLEDEA